MTVMLSFSWRAWNSPSCAIGLSAKADASRGCARGMVRARLNALREVIVAELYARG